MPHWGRFPPDISPRWQGAERSHRFRARGHARGLVRIESFAKPLCPGAGVGERQPGEVAKRDDASPALELVPKPKLADDAARAGFSDPQHEAGDGWVRK